MNTIDTYPGTWYCFFCTAPATVTAEIDGEYVTLAVLDSEGKESFCAPAESISIETDGKFRVLPTKASAGTSGGGDIHSNLNVGHGASAAVAAVCTLTLGDLGAGGTLADSDGQSVELENPHAYAVGYASFRDAAAACTLSIGEWSKEWEAAPGARAAGWLQLADGVGTFMVNGVIVSNPEDYTDVEAWNDALEPAGVFCTDESIESGSPKINIAAIEYGEAGNSITLEAVGEYFSVSGPTLAGGENARTSRDVYNDILADADCPVDVTLDADELGLGFTAREYGVNDTISAVGDMFSNWSGMSGGHGDYSAAELVTAIAGEFDDITAAAGEVEGTITLTANVAGAAANSITYTATGCFGSGTTRQGSTTRGKDAVEQTDYGIFLNGDELFGESAVVVDTVEANNANAVTSNAVWNAIQDISVETDAMPTEGSTNAVSSGGVYTALRELPAPAPEPLTPTTALVTGRVYSATVSGTAKDYQEVSASTHSVSHIFLHSTAPTSVTWPTNWKWKGDYTSAPRLLWFQHLGMEVVQNGFGTCVTVSEEFEHPEFKYTPLVSNEPVDGAKLQIVREETSLDGGDGYAVFRLFDGKTNTNTWCPFDKNMLREAFLPDASDSTARAVTWKLKSAVKLHSVVLRAGALTASQFDVNLQSWNSSSEEWLDASDSVHIAAWSAPRDILLENTKAGTADLAASKYRLLMRGNNHYLYDLRIFTK